MYEAHRESRRQDRDYLADWTVQELLENPDVSSIDVNFEQVPYLDSSALGMLLLLKERAGAAGKDLALVQCKDTVRQVLEIACFTKLFTIR